MAPEVGLEPTTRALTVRCSTIELLWNVKSLLDFTNRSNVISGITYSRSITPSISVPYSYYFVALHGYLGVEPRSPPG